MGTLAFISGAIKRDPRLRLAGGVALLGAVVAAVLEFTGGDRDLAVIGGLFTVGFMILLAIFITITESKEPRPRLAAFLVWSISLAFVASIALLALSYFICLPPPFKSHCATRPSYVRGEIADLPPPHKKQVGIALEGHAMGAINADTKAFHFVVLENPSKRSTLTVTVRSPDKAVDRDEDIKVHLSCIVPFFRSSSMLEWRYAEDGVPQPDGTVVATPALYENARKIGEFGRKDPILCQDVPAVPRDSSGWRALLPSWQAFAQAPASQPSPEIKGAIEDLTNEDTIVRRSARATLANGSATAVPSILEAMRDKPGDYRVQLGGSVALTEMLRRNKADADAIAKTLKGEEDRTLLLNAAGAKDRTLRIYASEFLYDLGDPQVSRQAVSLAAQTDDENARYNWLLVAQGGWHKLSTAQKQEAGADLVRAREASGPQTLKLFDKLK
ncbi:hypothetical protein DK26_23810 [Bosea sp. WAO]|uniref:hypothetical protein n=1 Tax=Bosea sp. WAO TaxID=406341 RepID=UPI00074895DB|nr:hypothetical protein [Bosea sp. WAO]KUL93355.1 hypothetical protein DK26_23810 [Bosea sp. WAO]